MKAASGFYLSALLLFAALSILGAWLRCDALTREAGELALHGSWLLPLLLFGAGVVAEEVQADRSEERR